VKTNKEKIILILIIFLALFLRIYRLSELMSFGGDAARDFLTARDISLKGQIPLLGCPSSVPWLHQGPLFIYLLGIVLWLGKYHPLAGGYFVGISGVFTVLGVYFLGRKFFSVKAGLLAAFFYATSPLIIIFDRFPYHLSLVSLFSIFFFIALYFSFNNHIFFVIAASLFGLLMQLELSNLVLLPILLIVLLEIREKMKLNFFVFSLFAFLIPWVPKIIYDFNNGFTQTIGFIAWIFHKLPLFSLFFGSQEGISLLGRINLIFVFLSRIIFWKSVLLSTIIFIFSLFVLAKEFKFRERLDNKGLYLVLLWLFFPLFGFIIHGSPSESYIPILFAPISLLVSFCVSCVPRQRLGGYFWIILVIMGIFNGYFVLSHHYFLLTGKYDTAVEKYNVGQSFSLTKEMAEFIVNDNQGKPYSIVTIGNLAEFSSSKLNLTYLTWYLDKGESDKKESLTYFVYNNNEQKSIKEPSLIKKFPYMTIVRKED